jgi:hypothetical protein
MDPVAAGVPNNPPDDDAEAKPKPGVEELNNLLEAAGVDTEPNKPPVTGAEVAPDPLN